ncbi:hypothetical protein HDZ31DRAFT_48225, partial [Schizophyllum fasciatum]
MHQVLQTPELLALICQFAIPRAKADLAQTCRALLEPVLDSLWAAQITDTALLGVLPPDVIATLEDGETVELTFNDYTPSDEEWDRIVFYTRRVRTLAVKLNTRGGCPPQFALHDRFIDLWTKYTQRRGIPLAMYPNATTINWLVEGPQSLSRDQHIWIPPCVSELALDLQAFAKHGALELAGGLFALADRRLESLKRLCIDRFATRYTEMSAFAYLIRALPALDSVEFDSVTADCVRALAEFRNIRDLYIGRVALLDQGTRSYARKRRNPPTYEVLEEEVVSSWRALCSTMRLESLNVTYRPHESLPSEALRPFFEVFGKCCRLVSLRLLDWCHRQLWNRVVSHHELTRAHLTPLMALRNLRTLHLSPRGWVNVDDGDVIALAQAWPHLEELRFSRMLPRSYPPPAEERIPIRTTATALITLATHCPRLRLLELPFDASTIPARATGSHAVSRGVQGPLEHLDLGNTTWEDTQRLAAFLLSLFPLLDFVESDVSHWLAIQGKIDVRELAKWPRGPDFAKLRQLKALVA